MPTLPLSSLIVLGAIVASFAAFAVTLLSVSIYVALGKPDHDKPVAREVTPAKRIGVLQPH